MAVERKERNAPIEREPLKRAKDFGEVSLGFDEERARKEADRCLGCKNAPCKKGCPVGVNIPEFIAEVKAGDYEAARKIIKATNSLPSVCGRVCPQELQCEGLCVRRKMEGSVAIGQLERFVGDLERDGGGKPQGVDKTAKRVAVVGSGPAGLTAAADLAKAGCDVTVYEAFHLAGGVLVYGIPEFRLPKDLVERQIDGLKNLGVRFELNSVVGKTVTIEQLLEDYDAVFLGTGAGLPQFLGIEGENLNGVCSANEYLTRVNLMKAYMDDSVTPVQRGKNVLVVGAGNVAMDAARTALRMGADSVTIVYRRGREEMPARAEEIHHAEQEGVKFELLTNPVKIDGKDGRAVAMTCVRMELGEPDASGRRRPVAIEGSEFELACDMVIVALGTVPNPMLAKGTQGLQTSKRGTIVVDEESMATSLDGVYAGGDVVTGAATVILAMGAGKKAAKAILDKLNG